MERGTDMNTAETSTTSPAETANRRLARTINIGLDLGAPAERGWTVDVNDDHLARCAAAGFTAIRLLVNLARTPCPVTRSTSIPPQSSGLVRAVAWATDHGLTVVMAHTLDRR